MSLDIALDFGSSFTRVADRSGMLLVSEPSVAALDEDTGRLLAFGGEALRLATGCAGRVRLHHPVRHGQLDDLFLAEQVIDEVLERAGATRLNRARVLVATHVDVTKVQRRTFERSLKRAGARQVRFIEQALACAIAADIAVEEPVGHMVVDVGGGTTDVALVALGGIVSSTAVPLGCDDLDEMLRDLLARREEVVVDRETASEIRRHLAAILAPGSSASLEVTGRDQRSGEPRSIVVGRAALSAALGELVEPILEAARTCIVEAPPDLANDLLGTGIVLAGGGAALYGLEERLARATGVPVRVAPEQGTLAVLGAARCLAGVDAFTPALSAAGRR